MHGARQSAVHNSEKGIALILVMLAIVVLSVLAASIVFSARSETYASYNYRTSLQADYAAKAGLQKAINFFNSDKYVAVPPSDASAKYDVSIYASTPITLYTAKARPVKCISGCASANQPVILQWSSGSFAGNYPTYLTNPAGDTVPTAYGSLLATGTLDPLSNSHNSGQYTVTATLESYRTVNDAFYPARNPKPYEVWYVVSTGSWNSVPPAGGVSAIPTSVQEATLAPVFLPYFANALYGMCNITMSGNVCTDSYNSTSGNYNGAAPQNCVASGSTGSNSFASGAGIGAGGNVTLNGGSYTVNGDVSYGATAPTYSSTWDCPTDTSGVTGSVGGVHGTVQPVPAIPEPPMPTFPSCSWYGGGGTSCNKDTAHYPTPPDPANLGNGDYVWTKQVSGIWYYEYKNGGTTTDYPMTYAGWAASTSYPVNAVIAIGNGHAYIVTTAGLSGTSAPTWPTGTGSTVTDGTTPANWAATTAYASGAVVQPSPANGHAYRALSAGSSGPTQPAFPTGSGATVNDPSPAVWAASTSYAVNAIIGVGGHLYTATTAGKSGITPPASWPTASGATVTDNANNLWAANTAYAVGNVVKPSAAGNGHTYIAIATAGNKKSGASAPAWPTTSGSTVVDNKVTWQENGSDAGVIWRESGIFSAITWQEIGPNTPVTWTENGTHTNILGDGTVNDPFRLPALSAANNSNICLTGGATPDAAVYYSIKDLYAHGTVYTLNLSNQPAACPPVGYTDYGNVVLDIYSTMDLGGQGVVQPTTAKATALVINVYNGGSNSTQSVTLSGQANLKALVVALGEAKLGGGGAGGAFYGSILAGTITDAGTYAVHYDQSMQVISGKLMPMSIRNYNRPKF